MFISARYRAAISRLSVFVAPLAWLSFVIIPVRNRLITAAVIALAAVTLVAWLIRFWRWRWIRFLIIVLVLVSGLFFALPSKTDRDPKMLAESYRKALVSYIGVTYRWGGETKLGIDCSGLIRAGMEDAALREGGRHLDGELIRHAASLWWFDESASALRDGYRGLTFPLFEAESLKELDCSRLHVGDLAIVGGGSHILVYVGDEEWMQADPGAGEVIKVKKSSSNSWLYGPASIVRWSILK